MFDNYTTKQLVELRSLCVDMILETEDTQQRMDVLLLMKYIDQELAEREFLQVA